MTSRERAEKFAEWHGGRWDAGDEMRLADEFDAAVREALEEAARVCVTGRKGENPCIPCQKRIRALMPGGPRDE